ncbi:MAG: DedA family protein [Planctomycetes bacterium]|nr:DedA family protein [Planctomycetota bacterium]
MDATALIEQYGYAALVVATFIEGEAALILAGYAARRGHLLLPWVMACAGLGVLLSDWTCFLLGRFCSRRLFAWFPGLRQRIATPLARIESDPGWFIVAFQFIPASSTVFPVAVGVSRVSPWRFLVFDLIGVAAWTSVFAILGYLFGAALGLFVADLHRFDAQVLLVVVGIILVWWCFRRRATNSPVLEPAPGDRAATPRPEEGSGPDRP